MVCAAVDEGEWFKIEQIIWKTKKGFSNYMISNEGSVKSVCRTVVDSLGRNQIKNEIILSQKIDRYGYMCVVLYSDDKTIHYFTVHRLVAELFVENPAGLKHVNHKDCRKNNNNYLNLEWCTVKQNNEHAILNGLIKTNIVVIQSDISGNDICEYFSIRDASIKTGIDNSCIAKVCKGIRKSAGGYLWRHKNK